MSGNTGQGSLPAVLSDLNAVDLYSSAVVPVVEHCFIHNYQGTGVRGDQIFVNVSHWVAAPVQTNVSGVPEVDVTHIVGQTVVA